MDRIRIFLAGIMQGSHVEANLHEQDYRGRLHRLLSAHWPQAAIYDPLADHQDSLTYEPHEAQRVFHHHIAMCRDVDLLVAFLPEASMGTAIEMWEARQAGTRVVTISPMTHNWVVRFCSDVVYADWDCLENAIRAGELDPLLDPTAS